MYVLMFTVNSLIQRITTGLRFYNLLRLFSYQISSYSIMLFNKVHSSNLATSRNLGEEYFLNIDYSEDPSTFLMNCNKSMAMPLTSSSLYEVFLVRVAFQTVAWVPFITL